MSYYILAGFAGLAAAALVAFHLETKRFVVNRYAIASSKLPEAFCGVKFALISDLHNMVYGEGNSKLLLAIEEEKPDFILIAGDMLVAKRGEDFSPAVEFLQKISARYPVYYSYGNHECRLRDWERYGSMAQDYEVAIKDLPLHMLHNRKVRMERGGQSISICGLEIGKEFFYGLWPHNGMTGRYLEKRLGKAESGVFHILIAHNPLYFPAYAEWGADLVVSGHNHGGIVTVPFLGGLVDPNMRLFPKYDKGLFKERNTQMVLSAGTGSHSPYFRAFNPPELVIVTLEREGESG